MGKKLTGRSINKNYIELHGQLGEFDIDSKKIKIRYFSTYASSKNKLHNSFDLLRELKPMRERVLAKEISNLDSLLQRDLNDFRVANELIPYLTNSQPPIAFFPAVLAVLIPKGFIAQNEESKYPIGKRSENKSNPIINYENNWKLEIFKFGDQESSLGALSIDPESVDIIVLDGQHRSNAFRVVSGTFENDRNSIYSTFYKDIEPLKDFKADLPVTIIWFDNDTQNFDPKLISRRLFVDVNNSAKKVSKSRTILLDEYEVPSLLTRFFYSKLADSRKFDSSEFSLFHSDFDLDSDINVSSNNAFAVTNPQIIYDIFSWLCLGRVDRYHALDSYSVGREAFRNSEIAFGRIFNSEDFNEKNIQSDDSLFDQKRVVLKSANDITAFSESYNEKLSDCFFNLFSDFNFFKNHYKAAELIASTQDEMDHVENTVWEDVFQGGEGLYYTFKDRNLRMKDDATWKKYLSAIDSIEKKFKEKRKEQFPDIELSKVNKAYDSANTKAFQIAIFMALDIFKEDQEIESVYEEFLELLNSKSPSNWVVILTDIRQKVVKETSPKMWPAYEKIILRAIQSDELTYYDSENFANSPDGKVFFAELKNSFNSWIDLNDEVDFEDLSLGKIGKRVYNKWIESAQNYTKELFSKADIDPISDVDHNEVGKQYLLRLIDKLKG